MPSQKSDKSNSIWILFIKVIIKIDISKINIKNTHLNTASPESSLKQSIFSSAYKAVKSFFNHFTCNKSIGNKFQCC